MRERVHEVRYWEETRSRAAFIWIVRKESGAKLCE